MRYLATLLLISTVIAPAWASDPSAPAPSVVIQLGRDSAHIDGRKTDADKLGQALRRKAAALAAQKVELDKVKVQIWAHPELKMSRPQAVVKACIDAGFPMHALGIAPVVVLRAAEDGSLKEIRLNKTVVKDPDELSRLASTLYGLGTPLEVEIVVGTDLRYSEVIRVISAVSGARDPNGNIVRLFERIRFNSTNKDPR